MTPGEELIIDLETVENLETVTFDYKVTSGTFNMALVMPDWASFYGYFAFDANGSVDPYDGVTLETLADGYTRVTLDVNALTKMTGTPDAGFNIFYVRGGWSDATGIIKNITLNAEEEPEVTEPEETEPEVTEPEETEPEEGFYQLISGEENIIEIENTEAVHTVSLEYKIENGGKIALALLPNWEAYYGYFDLDANGAMNTYDGVTTEDLGNGFIRVTFDVDALTKMVGTPNNVLNTVYVRGDWSTANGTLGNIIFNGNGEPSEPTEPEETEPEVTEPEETEPEETEPEETEPEETEPSEYTLVPNENLIIDLETVENLETVSFEYQVTSGTFNMSLVMSDWASFYGYFAFDANGSVDPYDGVTLETLADGYTRVTLDINALTKMTGTPNAGFSVFYVRGGWSDADGVIRNIQLGEKEEVQQEFEGGAFIAGENLTIPMENDQVVTNMSFDYKIESGEYFHIALISEDWENFFGYFKFDVNGAGDSYAGVTTQALSDGSIRVYLDLTAVNTATGTAPSNVLKLLYVRGAWTDANGSITNVCINGAAEEAPRGETIAAGVNKTIVLDNSAALSSLIFDYKIVDGEKINIALMQDWENFFGYYEFGTEGANDTYEGVTTEVLSDGYIRATFQLNSLNKMTGAPSTVLSMLYIRDVWTDANGFIDNIQIQ